MTLSLRCFSLLALALLPRLGHADAVVEARARFEHATAEYALGHYADAAVEYERAFELAPDKALLFDAAQAHRHAGHLDRALALYRSYLGLYGGASDERVAGRIAELEQSIAAHDARRALAAAASPSRHDATQSAEPKGERAAVPAQPNTVRRENAPIATARSAPLAPAPLDARRSTRRRWWLWTGTGVLAATAAVGVALGVTLGQPREPSYRVDVP